MSVTSEIGHCLSHLLRVIRKDNDKGLWSHSICRAPRYYHELILLCFEDRHDVATVLAGCFLDGGIMHAGNRFHVPTNVVDVVNLKLNWYAISRFLWLFAEWVFLLLFRIHACPLFGSLRVWNRISSVYPCDHYSPV